MTEKVNISAINEEAPQPSGQKVRIAVFDFDGTSITGNSPVLLVKFLAKKLMLGPTFLFRIICWAFCYHFHLPQNEAWVRGLVFSAFEGMPQSEVDQFLRDFYDERIECRFRAKAQEAIDVYKEIDDTVIVVSAMFEPVVLRAQEIHGYDDVIAVRMRVDEHGNYTREIIGEPIEGEAKVRAIEAYANKKFGEGNWELTNVFADHYSDIPLLKCAKHPFAVNPGPTLEKQAKKNNWPILDWEKEEV